MLRPTRVFVISDLHLGGDAPAMMSFAGELAGFIADIPRRASAGEVVELVIAGDVIDFLAIGLDGPAEPWTGDPARAVRKLEKAMSGRDAPVYAALAGHVSAGHGLTILLGNHDLELALPAVQAALCRELKCSPRAVRFVDDGRAWRLGRAVVEHGNRYDDANLNDWSSLREIASSHSRGEAPLSRLDPSFGSRLVCEVVNKHKKTFQFIDTLQPQGVLVAYLMATMDPSLISSLPDLLQVWRAQRMAERNQSGRAPQRRATRGGGPEPLSLDQQFGPELDTTRLEVLAGMRAPRATRGPATTVLRELLRPGHHALIEELDALDRAVPPWRLELVQAVLREMSWTDDGLEPRRGPTGPYGAAAERIQRDTGAQVVVMGHTHQAREVGPEGHATYINTGTWADVVCIPNEVLAATDEGLKALERWLRALRHDRGVRELRPSWAELRVEADGEVASAALHRGPRVRAT